MGTVYADVVIAKGMHRDVDARYATTHQFQQALEHLRDRHAAPRGRD